MSLPLLFGFSFVAEGEIESGAVDKVVGERLPSGVLGVGIGDSEALAYDGTDGVGSGGKAPDCDGGGTGGGGRTPDCNGGGTGGGRAPDCSDGLDWIGGSCEARWGGVGIGGKEVRSDGIGGFGGGGNAAATLPEPASSIEAPALEGELARTTLDGGGGGLLAELGRENRGGGAGSGGRDDRGIGGLKPLVESSLDMANGPEPSSLGANGAGGIFDCGLGAIPSNTSRSDPSLSFAIAWPPRASLCSVLD